MYRNGMTCWRKDARLWWITHIDVLVIYKSRGPGKTTLPCINVSHQRMYSWSIQSFHLDTITWNNVDLFMSRNDWLQNDVKWRHHAPFRVIRKGMLVDENSTHARSFVQSDTINAKQINSESLNDQWPKGGNSWWLLVINSTVWYFTFWQYPV